MKGQKCEDNRKGTKNAIFSVRHRLGPYNTVTAVFDKTTGGQAELELTFSLPHGVQQVAITGTSEQHLKIIRESLGVQIVARNSHLKISGDDFLVARAARVIEQLSAAARGHTPMTRQELLETITNSSHAITDQPGLPPTTISNEQPITANSLDVYLPGRRIKALTFGQQHYLEAILDHDLTLCTGPAGTGKTYMAVAVAVAMLKAGQVRRIALVRPAVEAGEKLGFLPGDMQQKVNPYLRPLLDALHDMMDLDQVQRFIANDVIEIIPLAFMRGRTLNDTMIILDEAQNTTSGQMLMFLTRLGHASKMVVTGDTTQIDLEDPNQCGLIDALRRLRHVSGVTMVSLVQADIVRHNLVQRIVQAYGDGAKLTSSQE